MRNITSDDLIPVNDNFRVSAGPGAGKTQWLINHINNVLNHSSKLVGFKKIACITYTNTGVDTIQNRLGDNTAVEVMTIHSFLYNNIVKPYAQFCNDEYNIDAKKIDGHDEPTLHKIAVKEWLEKHPNKGFLMHPFTINQILKLNYNFMAICNWLMSMKAKILEDNHIEFECNDQKAVYCYYKDNKKQRAQINNRTLNIIKGEILEYKRQLWDSGIIDHEDVLYISYRLVQDNPFILTVLRSKYPYLFVDEYQDTNPIQSRLLKLIANGDVVIGVIGDEAQSIYGFQGADVTLFRENVTENVIDYVIKENRRSTESILNFLKIVRTDICQKSLREVKGDIPTILVGDKKKALKKIQDEFGEENVQTLSRDNITSNIMRRTDNEFSYDKDIIEIIFSVDNPSSGNGYRSLNIVRCLKSVELAKQKKYKEAIQEMKKVYKGITDISEANKKSINAIKFLINKYAEYEQNKLIDFVNILKDNICCDISNLRSGKPKKLYEEIDYKQVAICINITEDISKSKTIHKAKGDEFNNVLIILNKESNIDFLTKPDLYRNEEHRVYYVAMSRARDNLFINVPKLSKRNRNVLEKYLKIINL